MKLHALTLVALSAVMLMVCVVDAEAGLFRKRATNPNPALVPAGPEARFAYPVRLQDMIDPAAPAPMVVAPPVEAHYPAMPYMPAAANCGCNDCGCNDCCGCEPPPVTVVVHVCDPCTGCPKPVEVCVPACCACEAPTMECRHAIIGVALYKFTWCNCDHEVKVRVFKDGHVKVRD